MPFEKGISGNPNGKPTGTLNKITKTVKETVLAVFNEIQEDPKVKLLQFAKDYPKEFYAIAAKLIPTELAGAIDMTVTWVEERTYETK